MEDDKIVDLLWQRNEAALEKREICHSKNGGKSLHKSVGAGKWLWFLRNCRSVSPI